MQNLQLPQKDISSAQNHWDKNLYKFSISSIRCKGLDLTNLQRVC